MGLRLLAATQQRPCSVPCMRSLKPTTWENRPSWQYLWKVSCSESLDVQIRACGTESHASKYCTRRTATASRSSSYRLALLAVTFLGSKGVLLWHHSWLPHWPSQRADFQILKMKWAVSFQTGWLSREGSNDFVGGWDVKRLPYEDYAGSQ